LLLLLLLLQVMMLRRMPPTCIHSWLGPASCTAAAAAARDDVASHAAYLHPQLAGQC
jgi:hypothetical protein